MTTDVASVTPDTSISTIARLFDERRISAVPVLDPAGAVVGVVSRTDLLRVGRIQAGSHRKAHVLTLPEKTAADLMRESTRKPLTTEPTVSLRDAARKICDERVHRLFVVDGGRLVGVISTLDMMGAVRDARIEHPISDIMSKPLFTILAQQPISAAVERLGAARVTGLVVIENEYPVGLFTQLEAMQSRDLPRDTRVEDVYDPAMLCLPDATKMFRAAEQASRLGVRRVLPCKEREALGIVTSFDFAKLVATALAT
ncbi:MAG: CBS domain-containing protein [Kofleriaceae bacterium]